MFSVEFNFKPLDKVMIDGTLKGVVTSCIFNSGGGTQYFVEWFDKKDVGNSKWFDAERLETRS